MLKRSGLCTNINSHFYNTVRAAKHNPQHEEKEQLKLPVKKTGRKRSYDAHCRIGMQVVSCAKLPGRFTGFGHQADPDRPSSRPEIFLKLLLVEVRSPKELPNMPQEQQESAKELAQIAPRPRQE